jgi:hypothetical protein
VKKVWGKTEREKRNESTHTERERHTEREKETEIERKWVTHENRRQKIVKNEYKKVQINFYRENCTDPICKEYRWSP